MLKTNTSNRLLAGIEAGGTKFNCVIARAQGEILAECRIPTSQPSETLSACLAFFKEHQASLGEITALGIGTFGPVELNKQSPSYGCIKNTPKKGWSNTAIYRYFKESMHIPVAIETDVNAAALGEYSEGAARGCDYFIYITVGTGIGASILINGKPYQGIGNPEIGHILIPRHPQDNFNISSCPFHDSCVEGLASGAALNLRFPEGITGVRENHNIWNIESYYIALLCVNLTQTIAPQKIVLGGGVMQQHHLIQKIRKIFLQLINSYAHETVIDHIEDYLIPASSSGLAGVKGALFLAESVAR